MYRGRQICQGSLIDSRYKKYQIPGKRREVFGRAYSADYSGTTRDTIRVFAIPVNQNDIENTLGTR